MTIQQFNLLYPEAQEKTVWCLGKFLINFDHGNVLCDVYEVSDFYVSLSYVPDKNLKAKIVAAVYPDQLPYVDRIGKIFE